MKNYLWNNLPAKYLENWSQVYLGKKVLLKSKYRFKTRIFFWCSFHVNCKLFSLKQTKKTFPVHYTAFTKLRHRLWSSWCSAYFCLWPSHSLCTLKKTLLIFFLRKLHNNVEQISDGGCTLNCFMTVVQSGKHRLTTVLIVFRCRAAVSDCFRWQHRCLCHCPSLRSCKCGMFTQKLYSSQLHCKCHEFQRPMSTRNYSQLSTQMSFLTNHSGSLSWLFCMNLKGRTSDIWAVVWARLNDVTC